MHIAIYILYKTQIRPVVIMFQPDWAADNLNFTWADLLNLDDDPQDSFLSPDISPPQDISNANKIDVHDWLDGAFAPPSPCTHCTQARLQCLILRTTTANPNPIRACSSCVALFRECSLAAGEKRQPSHFETPAPVYGHMHGLAEEPDYHLKQPDCLKPEGEGEGEEEGQQTPAFSRKGARVLRNWFHQHHEFPYPTDEEKDALALEARLSKRQVSNWFSNARRRHKQHAHVRRDNAQHFYRAGSPAPSRATAAAVTDFDSALMTPMERWQSSPPDSEPVSESAIQNAIVSSQFDFLARNAAAAAAAAASASPQLGSSRAGSSRSSQAGYSESSGSMTSAWSNQSDMFLPPGHHQQERQHRRRRRRRENRTPVQDHLYQCTFCRYSSKKRHDWARHERSVHLSLDSWLCTPDLSAVRQVILEQPSSSSTPDEKCALCGAPNPSPTHIDDTHDFAICADRPLAERTFGRKDHFWQHLHKFHGCAAHAKVNTMQQLDALCRCEQRFQQVVRSRCGFCGCVLQTWEARTQHLAEHFKQGWRMSQWRGEWGVEGVELREVELREN